MIFAPRGPALLLPVFAIALLFLATVFAPQARVRPETDTANLADAVDAIVTGSVGPAVQASLSIPPVLPEGSIGEPLPTVEPVGTPKFREALALIEDDPRAAYETAKSLPADAERRALQWAAITYGDGEIDYRSVLRFREDAPVFAGTAAIRTRLEQALVRSGAGSDEIIRVLGGAMPATVSGQIALALAYVEDGQKERATDIAREIWTTEFLSKADEDRVHKKLGELLTADDHWARAVFLMMNDRATAVQRLYSFMTPEQKSLAVARNAVSRNAKDAKKLLDDVDPSMQAHPVYIFSRAQRARQFDLLEDAADWMAKAPADLPESAEWWYERRTLIRQLLAQKNHALAYEVAAGYATGPEGRVVEAQFHAGWIALSFLNEPVKAVSHFEAMRELSTLPESVSQSNYWLGKARLAAGDKLGANEAFAAGAKQRTVFYGLLARAELGFSGAQLLEMPDEAGSEALFEANDVVQAVRLLAGNGKRDWAIPLLQNFAYGLEDAAQLAQAARLAEALDEPSLAIKIAEDAGKRGVALDLLAFPRDRLPVTRVAAIDHAAIYAITKQESHFQLGAVSSAGARGFMQLMPGTAKETAQKLGLEYSKSKLTTDGAYNALLGSTYLAAQLDRYDGSLVLAAAAYNAGPGNANKWIEANGDPRSAEVDPAVWIEQIPLQETRTYVKRVLGNYLVYRAQLGDTSLSMLEALRSIQ